LPAGFGLSLDTSTMRFADDSVLMGGSPLRLLRLSTKARSVAERWAAGAPVGPSSSEQKLARRLVSAGTHVPRPATADYGPNDVTVVIPVRDRPVQLDQLLAALPDLRCIVVDDASAQPSLTKQIARRAGAAVILLDHNAGPSAARNAGLRAATTPLVAFIDSDCVPSPDWLIPLLGHFNDPVVAAVAPRVVPADTVGTSALNRYEAVRSSLDRGTTPGVVRPMSRIPYVPSAALVVRRSAVAHPFFDERLRGGEDVDLVWRLADAGWDVRYEPAATVSHEGPQTIGAWLSRRAFYGTTAAPLSKRHPDAMAPLHTSIWTASVWGCLAARRPLLAAGALAATVAVLARRLNGMVDQPVQTATRIAGGGTVKSMVPALGGLSRAWALGLVLALVPRPTRRAAAVALLVPALADWRDNSGGLDPLTYAALHMADDVAYGIGVWKGCVTGRTLRPLVPRIALRSRTWTAPSLKTQLSDQP
jgi:mycofactocin system glycosyltransferase